MDLTNPPEKLTLPPRAKSNNFFSIESLISRRTPEEQEDCGTSSEKDFEPEIASPFQPFEATRGLFDLPGTHFPQAPFQKDSIPFHILQKFSLPPTYFNYNLPLLYNTWIQNAGLFSGLLNVPQSSSFQSRFVKSVDQDSATAYVPLSSPTADSEQSLSPYDLSRHSGK